MKIAITADPEIPVPPIYYGGIERIVSMLIPEFILAGHEVTLFANESSQTEAVLKPYPGKTSKSRIDTIRNMHLISREIYNGQYDVIHSFSRLAYLTLVLPLRLPKIMSYQRRPTSSQIIKAQKLAHNNSLIFTGCSDFISDQIKPFAPVHTIYNGVEMEKYNFAKNLNALAPLIFLGRLEPIKGAHNAIEIALRSGKKLILAGNIPVEHQNYFDQKIAPFIDGEQIQYIGPVNDQKKSLLLNSALAFLMPIEWDEPFGIVMVEALACGTPVIAIDRGAVPEIIREGINGFICKNIEHCVKKVSEVHLLDRASIRLEAISKFSSKAISEKYLKLYLERLTISNRNRTAEFFPSNH